MDDFKLPIGDRERWLKRAKYAATVIVVIVVALVILRIFSHNAHGLCRLAGC